MEKMVLKIDWYTKVVLTIIALTLIGFLIRPLFIKGSTNISFPKSMTVSIDEVPSKINVSGEIDVNNYYESSDETEWYKGPDGKLYPIYKPKY